MCEKTLDAADIQRDHIAPLVNGSRAYWEYLIWEAWLCFSVSMVGVVLFRELFHVFLMLSAFFLRLSIALEKHLLI